MNPREGIRARSLRRMDELCTYFRAEAGVRAILAFGSLGDIARFDDCADLDFLVVCDPEQKGRLLESTASLSAISPVAYYDVEYTDAVKLLFSDGVLCDFGIVTEEQLPQIYHGEGRVLWKESDFLEGYTQQNLPPVGSSDVFDPVGDILMRVYVGVLRERRGEKASAFEEIQVLAVGRLLKLLGEEHGGNDPFSSLRRAETAMMGEDTLSRLMPGYGRSEEAAKAVLDLIHASEQHMGLIDQIYKLL